MDRIDVGTLTDLQAKGCLTGKAGSQPVCVFWHEDRAYALDDRCPHMGFPLHRGSLQDGLLTCHWHDARFDLASGGTLDPWADNVHTYPVEVVDGRVRIVVSPDPGLVSHLQDRLREGLEDSLTLVIAKSVLGLLDAGVGPAEIVRTGVDFGTTFRGEGWGAGLTVLVAMANMLPRLDQADRALALVQGLAFVARDTAGQPPRFRQAPLGDAGVDAARLAAWYRRFVETRSGDAAERVLATAVVTGGPPASIAAMMTAAATDHVFLDEGHTLDFTNKAFEALDHLGWDAAPRVLPTLAHQTAAAFRHEEDGSWRHPHDLVAFVADVNERLPELLEKGSGAEFTDAQVAALGWAILEDDPNAVVDALCEALQGGASGEQVGRAVAYAAALRLVRFHTQNDHADWNQVHHAFTTANAFHQAAVRYSSPELLRGAVHGALRVYLDRFLNIPAARLPESATGSLDDLQACWDSEGNVDRAGGIVHGYLRGGGDPAAAVAALGRALLTEDAGFHWFQVVEAAVRQFHAWPAGSEEGALILTGVARFLAAHTPTRRELPQIVRIATRLRRGEELFAAS